MLLIVAVFVFSLVVKAIVVVHVSSVRLTLSGLSLAARAPCDWSLSAPGTGDTDTLYHEHTLAFSAKYTFQPAEQILKRPGG